MDWVAELRRAMSELGAGARTQVSFAGGPGMIGELGREFNALAEGMAGPAGDDVRERAHRLRNQLAGILAAVHVLRETAELSEEQRAALAQVIEEGKRLEGRLRAG